MSVNIHRLAIVSSGLSTGIHALRMLATRKMVYEMILEGLSAASAGDPCSSQLMRMFFALLASGL